MKGILFLLFGLRVLITYGQEVKPFLPIWTADIPNMRDFSLNFTEDEFYFTVESFKKDFSFIAYSRKIDGKWEEPKVVSFSGKFKDLEPFLAPDGLSLYFVSNRNITSSGTKSDMDIWYVKRKDIHSDWSSPIRLDETINTDGNEFYPCITNSGNLYFTAERNDSKGKEDIYVSELVDGKYLTPVSLDIAVNSANYEFNAFVSPEEDLIIFSSYGRSDDLGGGDLYMSRKSNGKWTPSKNLGNRINSAGLDYCPFVTKDKEQLYFSSSRSAVLDVEGAKLGFKKLLKEMYNIPNGLTRIYTVSLNKN